MGTKNNPGKYDCYKKALPDEPIFVLLARDPDFSAIVNEWANRRTARVRFGFCPISDLDLVDEALSLTIKGAEWREKNDGNWRK